MNPILRRQLDARRRSAAARRAGFTLLEVIVAVTIVALLATMIVPKLLDNIWKSKQKLAKAEISTLVSQVNLYLTDVGQSAPGDDFTLEALLSGSKPYLKSQDDLLDPWGNPYSVIIPGSENADFDIVSFGSDGKPGGEGDAMDISSAVK